jgi:2-C-methyl-D-erythritol 2,4-cyclodiphosphate synthase
MDIRIGQGFDLHRLVEDRELILAGVKVPYTKGLLGHSDADIAIHAIIDAIVGALSLGDIGKFFPDTDPKYKNADSRVLLREVVAKIHQEYQYEINNVDVTIILQRPKLRDYIDAMRLNLAQDLKIEVNSVSIKAKTSEGVGIVGREEAAIAQAVVLLIKK